MARMGPRGGCDRPAAGCHGLRTVAGVETAKEPAVAKLSSRSKALLATPERAALAAGARREPAPVAKVGRSVAGGTASHAVASNDKVAPLKSKRAVRHIGFESESQAPPNVADNDADGTTSARRWSSRAPAIDDSPDVMTTADETSERGTTETVLAALEEASDMGAETVADTETAPGEPSGSAETSARTADGASKRLSDRLKIPEELPGAAVPPLRLPKFDPDDRRTADARSTVFSPNCRAKTWGSPKTTRKLWRTSKHSRLPTTP